MRFFIYKKIPRGYLVLLALVFGTIFVTVLGALASSVLSHNRSVFNTTARSEGVTIAEAGLEYYRWHLAHLPNDLQNGTGQPGPYSIPYQDPEGSQAGTIALGITGNKSCNTLTSIDITSKGTPTDMPAASATLIARYAKPTVALYSYVLNSSDWADSGRTINGPYHTNVGVRMDGTANSSVTSSLSTWNCSASFGCSPTVSKPGVWGTGPNQTLWSFPTPQVDFTAIAADFTTLKTTAQNTTGALYFPRVSTGTTGVSAGKGYHLIFNANGTVTVSKVTSETNVPSIPISNPAAPGLQPDYALIASETPVGTYAVSTDCGLIFVEDNTWIEGVIPSEVTVVAANVTTAGISPDIYLPNNITYSNTSGISGLTAIASNDVLITPNSPTNMTINGVFVAQSGSLGRNLYVCTTSPYDIKNTLTIHGTTVANKRSDTSWTYSGYGCGGGTKVSGYATRVDAFDRQLSTNPPPFTPNTSATYQFVDWHQQ
jgi:hypothetical protein